MLWWSDKFGRGIGYQREVSFARNAGRIRGIKNTLADRIRQITVREGSIIIKRIRKQRGNILQADGQEGICIAELDLKQLRNYREKEVHGNAYRHPKKYGMLVDAKIDKPFVRNDYREKERATQNLWRRI